MENPTREQRYLGRIQPGMDVCDVGGDKIGRIGQIHRFSELSDPADEHVPDEVMEVKTGFLGLGKHLYVPLTDIQEVLPESVFLTRPKEDFASIGYYAKPAHLT
jgi:hypothetical protein